MKPKTQKKNNHIKISEKIITQFCVTNYDCGEKMFSIVNTLDTFLGFIFKHYMTVLLLLSLFYLLTYAMKGNDS
jgi:hypothetical protein